MKTAALAFGAAMILGAAAAPLAQEPAPDKSLDRMRSVLEKPALRLTLPDVEPMFKVRIEALRPMHDIFEKPAWQLDPIGWQPPGIGLDLSFVFRYMAKVKYEHDVRAAHKDVQREIDDYCAAQPNAATLQLCANSRPR
jgi:hypothetical protein